MKVECEDSWEWRLSVNTNCEDWVWRLSVKTECEHWVWTLSVKSAVWTYSFMKIRTCDLLLHGPYPFKSHNYPSTCLFSVLGHIRNCCCWEVGRGGGGRCPLKGTRGWVIFQNLLWDWSEYYAEMAWLTQNIKMRPFLGSGLMLMSTVSWTQKYRTFILKTVPWQHVGLWANRLLRIAPC